MNYYHYKQSDEKWHFRYIFIFWIFSKLYFGFWTDFPRFWVLIFLSPVEVFTVDCLESVEICYGLVISDFIVFRIIEVPYSDRVRKGLRVIDLRFRLTSNRMKTQQLCCIFCIGRCAVKWLQRLEIDMRIKWIGHGTTCRLHHC